MKELSHRNIIALVQDIAAGIYTKKNGT